jgi:16S rRNA (uracil1498-N3)-methyltransferase
MPQCFFLTATDSELQLLPEDKTHHIVNVLKMQAGERVRLHDGQGRWADATLEILGKKRVSARLVSPWQSVTTEPERSVTVFQALPKTGDKVEQVLQHGTELGAAGFVLFASERAQAKLDDRERIARKRERWEELIRNAAEQSGRGVLPRIVYTRSLEEALGFAEGSRLLLDEAGEPLPATLGEKLAVFVGPESGFTAAEKQAILTRDALGVSDARPVSDALRVSLGPRTLRTETAALAALARLL